MLKHTLSILALLLMPLFSLSAQDITFEQVMEKCRENVRSAEFEINSITPKTKKSFCRVNAVKKVHDKFGFLSTANFSESNVDYVFNDNYELQHQKGCNEIYLTIPRRDPNSGLIGSSEILTQIFVSSIFGTYDFKAALERDHNSEIYYFELNQFLSDDEIIFQYNAINKESKSVDYFVSLIFDQNTLLLKRYESQILTEFRNNPKTVYSIENLKINTLKPEDFRFEMPLGAKLIVYYRSETVELEKK